MKNIAIVKSYLGMFNLLKCKYAAAMEILYIIKDVPNLIIDWEMLERILTDVELFQKYKTEAEYIEEILGEVIKNENFVIENITDFLNVPVNILDMYSEYIVTQKELEVFNEMYKNFIRTAIYCCKNGINILTIEDKFSAKFIKGIYPEKGKLSKKVNNFVMSIYNFIHYNGLCNIKMYYDTYTFGKTKLICRFEISLIDFASGET